MAQMNEVAAQLMEHLCWHDSHGYTQGARWGNGTSECVNIDGQDYWIANGDRDCSSGIISCYQAAGLNLNATYTGNMLDAFLGTGLFEWKPMSFTAQRGDIYLNIQNHTAMCTCPNPDTLAEFCIAETGGIYGEEGDQTGWEAYVHGYYDYPWDGILHFIGGEAIPGGGESYTPAPAEKAPAPSVRYRVKRNGKWQGWRSDGATAGKVGKPITGICIDMGGHGWYQVKTKKHGWLEPVRGHNIHDDEHGYAGYEDSEITAVRVYYETPNPAETGYYSAKYAVSPLRQVWYEYQYDDDTWNGQDGYAGDGELPIDRFCMVLE